MFIRYLLLVCLLIVSAMPICTAESTTMPARSSDVAEFSTISATSSDLVASDQAMTMEEALECVTISAEDWLDGYTYYIRYTFINPTDVAIDKKVDLTTVAYRRCAYHELWGFNQHGSSAITALVIPPHGTYTTTLNFPLFTPVAQYHYLLSTVLYFTDGSALYHGYQPTRETPLYALSTFVSGKNELCLAIRNRSRLTPITSISNLTVQLRTFHPSND